MKKILYVANIMMHIKAFHLPYMKMLKEMGYEVHVAANEDKDSVDIPYCDKMFILPMERSPISKGNIQAYRDLKKIIESEKYDIIHCHTPVGGILARLAARKLRKNGTKVIYTAHGFHFFRGAPLKNWIIYYPIESIFSRFTDAIITINQEDYKRVKKLHSKKTLYTPGVGVNTDGFIRCATDKSQKRGELHIPDGATVLLSVGEPSKRKNQEVILHALAKLNDPNLIYILCGKGELYNFLQGLAKNLGICERVFFLGYRKDVKEIYASADVFLLPSYQEGLPVALMEAMAMGLPVVCSKIRGNTELIDEGVGGYLCEPADAVSFAEAIAKLVSNPDLCAQMGAYNREKVKAYDIKNVKTILKELYETL